MRIKRTRFFSGIPKPGETLTQQPGPVQQQQQAGEEPTSKDLQLEQARLQRQQIQIQHQKSQLLLKEEMSKRRAMVQMQKMRRDEEQDEIRNIMKARKAEADSQKGDRTSLYKTHPKTVQPVGMPKGK